MESFFGLSAAARKHFNETVEQAERKFRQATNAVDGTNNILGIDTRSIWEREKIRVPATKEAALEYLGTILFFLIDKFSLLRLSDDELQSRVNVALAGLRRITFEEKWPKSIPLSPGWHEREEQEFDAALIQWLENREEWRRYEAHVLPQIVDATVDHPSVHEVPSPLAYFQVWPLEKLSVTVKGRIRAGLLEIHGGFLDGKVKEDVECWRLAYDLIAEEVDRDGLLSEDFLNERLPEMIADAGAGGGWSSERMGRPQPTGIFSVRCGSQFYPLWRRNQFLEALKGRITHWIGRLLVGRATAHDGRPSTKPLHTGHSHEESRALRAHRLKILKKYIAENSLGGMDGLARRAGSTTTALYAMARGDRTRYSQEKLDEVLKKVGCSSAEWHGIPNPRTPA